MIECLLPAQPAAAVARHRLASHARQLATGATSERARCESQLPVADVHDRRRHAEWRRQLAQRRPRLASRSPRTQLLGALITDGDEDGIATHDLHRTPSIALRISRQRWQNENIKITRFPVD